jgi:hypothetical protein
MREHTDVKKLLQLILIAVVALVAVEVRDDLRAATASTRLATGGTLPTKCQLGDAYVKTGSVAGLYLCAAADTWGSNALQVSVVLTNAQIKALPTTPVLIVAAPAAGYTFEPIRADLYSSFAAGAYTNIDANANGTFWYGASYVSGFEPFSYLANDASITNGSATRVTDFLGSTTKQRVRFVPYVDSEDLDDYGLMGRVVAQSSLTGKAIYFQIGNGGSGNFTGGNSANTLTVRVLYDVVRLP